MAVEQDLATGAKTATGAAKGAKTGAEIGTAAAPFLGPLAPAGPVIGAILGGLIGGGTQLAKGKQANQQRTAAMQQQASGMKGGPQQDAARRMAVLRGMASG